MKLVTQPPGTSAFRKVKAGALGAAAASVATSVVMWLLPSTLDVDPADIQILIIAAYGAAAWLGSYVVGYLTRERAK